MSKRYVMLAVAALSVGAPIHAQLDPSCPVRPTALRAMRECYRPVLVFAPSARDASFRAQQALLEQYADDMMDRNLLYVPVLASSASFEAPLDAPYVEIQPAESSAIRALFGIGRSEFAVVLVGKDGGEKFRSARPVSVLKLDDLVDAMPMGSQEKAARSAKPR